jgi:transposase
MSYYVGLDISVKLTAICIIDETGRVVTERVVASDPVDIGRCIEEVDGEVGRIGLEAGPLAPWLFGGLADRGLPVVCIEVRQMKAFAKASPIKTDRRDARLIAQAMRTGLFKVAHVKTDYSQRVRLLLRHRQAMIRRNKDLINTVRGTLKAFGIRTGGGKNTLFAQRVRAAIDDKMILAMTEPLLAAYEHGLQTLAKIEKMVLTIARKDAICRRLMTVPGIGPVVALTFRTGVDVVHRFDKSRLVAAVFGLTPRVHASGEIEQVGRITKCGDAMVRALLYEAANVMMTRCRADNWLKSWALGIARRRGVRRAKVALARRLAVVMHRMWIDGTDFLMERPIRVAA